jgi:ATP-dependent helicase IRC3
MAKFVDGNTFVSDVRGEGMEDAIARLTGLSIPTIRAKLREAHGHTKLCNLFRQWPSREEEIGGWTTNFALQCEAFDEIARITGVGPRVVKRRLEEAHGKTLVQNVFETEWFPPTEEDRGVRRPDRESHSGARPPSAGRTRLENGSPQEPTAPQEPAIDAADVGEPIRRWFRRYDLNRARAIGSRREPVAHQSEALAKLQDWYRSRPSPHAGGILALPTGGGKTFTAVRFLCQEPLSDGYKILWLAHTHHLLEQAIEAFGPPDGERPDSLEVAHITGARERLDVRVVSATPGHFPVSTVSSADDVVIATLQTIVAAFNRGHERLKAFLDSSEGKLMVVFDEAHHAPAPSYCKLLERLREAYPRMFLLGLTATPTYSDERRQGWLKKLFPQEILYTVARSRLIAMGVLSKPVFENRRTEITMEIDEAAYQRWLSSYGDLPDDIVTKLAENRERNDFIADAYVEGKERYGKALIFADRWIQCDYLREALRKRGVRADVVYSHVDARLPTAEERNQRSKDENAKVLHRFRSNELDVLINVKMLTEGTDVPSVKSVFLTRQTTSSILLTQMIGRALRGPRFGGTEEAHIVSFIDNWKQVINFADYENLPVGQADDTLPEYGRRPPLQLISIELIRRLARQMSKGSGAATAPFITLLPVGWYRVEYQTRAKNSDDISWQRHLVMVFANEKGRYDAFIDALGEQDLAKFSSEDLALDDVREDLLASQAIFFGSSEDHPGAELLVDMFHIARHMGQGNGEPPVFFKFEERSAHDLDAIANECVRLDLGVRALDEKLLGEYTRVDRFWRALYPNRGLFCDQYQRAQRRILDAHRHGFEPERYNGVVSTPERPPIREPSEAVKDVVFRRDGRHCCCCGSDRHLQIDHIVPAYLGGASDIDQLQTLCRTCNTEKSINEWNFRVSRPPIDSPARFEPAAMGRGDDPTLLETWRQYIKRSINFFYRCAAIDEIGIEDDTFECRIVLRPTADPTWIEPHLENFRAKINEDRAAAGLAPLAKLRVTVVG